MTDGNDKVIPDITSEPGVDEYNNTFTRIYGYGGLTKRELFAAMAMQGLMARPNWPFDSIAGEAIFVADALIDELNKDSE